MMNKFGMAMAVFGCMAAAAPVSAATFAITGDTSAGIPVFNRPVGNGSSAPISLSGVGTAVAYSTFSFAVQQAATYDFRLTSTTLGYDPYLILYAGGFNPSSPLSNALVADDDSGPDLDPFFSRALQTGIVYTAVVTGFDNLDRGTFNLNITSDRLTPAVPEPATWAMMLVGFAMIGATARYRRRSVRIAYA